MDLKVSLIGKVLEILKFHGQTADRSLRIKILYHFCLNTFVVRQTVPELSAGTSTGHRSECILRLRRYHARFGRHALGHFCLTKEK